MRQGVSCLVSISLLLGAGAPGSAQPSGKPADRPRLVAQVGHSSTVQAVACSHDGRWVLTASQDNVAVLWDAADGKELRRFVGHPGNIFLVAFSPDGRVALTAGHATNESRLWDVQTGRLLHRLQQPGLWETHAATFSPDGRWLLTYSSANRPSAIWEVATGKKVRDLPVFALLSPDGRHVLAGGKDGTARLSETTTGKEVRAFKCPAGEVHPVAFSPDGNRLLTAGGDRTGRVWDAATGKVVSSFPVRSAFFCAAAFAPDGRRLLQKERDPAGGRSVLRLLDADTGEELHRLDATLGLDQSSHAAGDDLPAVPQPFSPDGKRILAVGKGDKMPRLWDVQTGRELVRLQYPEHTGAPLAMTFSPDGRHVLTSGYDYTVRLWDAETGKELRRFGRQVAPAHSADFSRSGGRLLLVAGGTASVWELATGKERRRVQGCVPFSNPAMIDQAALSPDGRLVLGARDFDSPVRLWDVDTGQELPRLPGHAEGVTSVAFSPDGRRAVTAGRDAAARVWDLPGGEELHRLTHPGIVWSAAFAPDGRQVRTVVESTDNRLWLWDAESGRELPRFEQTRVPKRADLPRDPLPGVKGTVFNVWTGLTRDGRWFSGRNEKGQLVLWEVGSERPPRVFDCPRVAGVLRLSPDGRRMLVGLLDGRAQLWDVETGRHQLLNGHTDSVDAAAFSPDGRHLLTGSRDGTSVLWDLARRQELCRLILFRDGTWAVIDKDGRYDASDGGDVEGLHWVVGLEPIALSQLKERYYDPGLLAKYLGFSKEPPRDVAALEELKLYPDVAVAQADPKKPQFDVALTNRGGGIGRVMVLVNGKERTEDARPRGADAGTAKLEIKLDLSADPRLVPGQKNTVEVLAYNADGYLCSRGLVREFTAPGAAAAGRPALHAVVAGVAQYRGEKLNLRFAAKDAEDFAAALRLGAGRLFGADKVHVTLLTTVEAERRPDRANLVKALGALKATKPGDLVVVYLAGHGVTQGGQDGDWHYLTADAQSADLADPAVRKQVSLSSAELTDLLKAAPAQKQVLILDTCHSGRVVEKLTEKRDVPGSQVRALERVKDRSGVHVLAGCAADSVSYEASKYGQGLLTYSLLLGMRGAKLREGEYVDVVDLFSFAADKVPELARDIGGVQRPTVASPRGASFDLGRLTAEDRGKVPLQQFKPVLVPSRFQDEKRFKDVLGLEKRVDDRLREQSATPRGAKLVFVDASDYPGGMQASGQYKVEGNKVTVSVKLFDGDKEKAAFSVEGVEGKPDELAGKIAAEVEKRLVKP